jgi:ADP-ribose pyrophosphatase
MRQFDWIVVKTEYIIKDNWISLRADTCKMPNGRIVAPYYVLEYPEWVNVVAITVENEVIFVKQYRHGLGKTLLELPCGNVEENESPRDAIKRELLEETGYSGPSFIETGLISANPATHANLTHCFLASGVSHVQSPIQDSSEQLEIVLIPFDDVMGLVRRGEVVQGLHISSILLSFQTLGKC